MSALQKSPQSRNRQELGRQQMSRQPTSPEQPTPRRSHEAGERAAESSRREAVRDYTRVEAAIRYLEERQPEQPRLAEVAEHVGLSPWHFQRLFQRWAGVSPKRFLQFLTVEHAKRMLDASETVLETTWSAGLSSPGRLHDLFVTVEAVSPGEYKTGGEGLEIRWGVHPTPFGEALVAVSDRGVCQLSFGDPEEALETLQKRFPEARRVEAPETTGPVSDRIFRRLRAGRGPADVKGGLSLHLRGTNFQLRVWRALLSIPDGGAVTYGRIARSLGQPGAAQAVGRAVGANPVAVLIPCHRVLRESGGLGGYRWGTERKWAILGWEGVKAGRSLFTSDK
jgi:AraC family transcriptional regulator of adaptative response/methylated-DNA-[protein]-cysteine methyltransferase